MNQKFPISSRFPPDFLPISSPISSLN
ncbi:hypothetical protein CY0110_17432 [Crocosphaera chwakensis CCY0110]|uniref:Uncharacterized protein n=1 Tax=Crocosphaera chwakensis CCY0110 TaxID=391612 RepID=A3IIG8_9CHRO|nr:hypothetical protein CY0110_17432 [Crocosphaera chwakensis CCY0110]